MPFDAVGFRDDGDGGKPRPAVAAWGEAVLTGLMVVLVVMAVMMLVR